MDHDSAAGAWRLALLASAGSRAQCTSRCHVNDCGAPGRGHRAAGCVGSVRTSQFPMVAHSQAERRRSVSRTAQVHAHRRSGAAARDAAALPPTGQRAGRNPKAADRMATGLLAVAGTPSGYAAPSVTPSPSADSVAPSREVATRLFASPPAPGGDPAVPSVGGSPARTPVTAAGLAPSPTSLRIASLKRRAREVGVMLGPQGQGDGRDQANADGRGAFEGSEQSAGVEGVDSGGDVAVKAMYGARRSSDVCRRRCRAATSPFPTATTPASPPMTALTRLCACLPTRTCWRRCASHCACAAA